MFELNSLAVMCIVLSLGVTALLAIRKRKTPWGSALVTLVLVSGYGLLHVASREFIYVDNEQNIPGYLHLAGRTCLVGFAVGVIGLLARTARYILKEMRSA